MAGVGRFACRTACSPPARKRSAGGPICCQTPDLRQHSHAGLNKGEASNSVRRTVFFHRQGEIRDRTFENQSFRACGLSLITAAIVHWNTVYLDRAVRQLAFSPMARFAARDRLGLARREAMAATIARNWVSL